MTKVLMISGDKKLLEPGTDAHARLMLQVAQVEQLDVFVWPQVHTLREVFRAARATHYDVVTSQDPLLRGALARRAAKITGARLNLQVHMDLPALPFWKRALAGFNLRYASSVRVVSEKIKKQVEQIGTKADITVLPVYVDIERFSSVVRSPGAQKTVLWVGRFEEEKDPALAVRIFKEVCAADIDAKLIMLGKGSLEAQLRESAQGLAVEFPGWQSTLPYLAGASVVLCTSRHESWGASIVEALAAGVPVVAPDIGIAREAGAVVAKHSELTQKTVEVLQTNAEGKLLLNLPNAHEWAVQWKQSLTNV